MIVCVSHVHRGQFEEMVQIESEYLSVISNYSTYLEGLDRMMAFAASG